MTVFTESSYSHQPHIPLCLSNSAGDHPGTLLSSTVPADEHLVTKTNVDSQEVLVMRHGTRQEDGSIGHAGKCADGEAANSGR